jgi:hypothetical protein
MSWLAIRRDWTSVEELFGDLVPPMPRSQVLVAMQGLQRRSLVERRIDRGAADVQATDESGRPMVQFIDRGSTSSKKNTGWIQVRVRENGGEYVGRRAGREIVRNTIGKKP